MSTSHGSCGCISNPCAYRTRFIGVRRRLERTAAVDRRLHCSLVCNCSEEQGEWELQKLQNCLFFKQQLDSLNSKNTALRWLLDLVTPQKGMSLGLVTRLASSSGEGSSESHNL